MSESIGTTEGEERTQTEGNGRVCIVDGIANEHTVVVGFEDDLLLEYHTTHTIDGGRHPVELERADVLMTVRVHSTTIIEVKSEVELGTMLNDRRVERGEQDMVFIINRWDRNY